MFNNRIILSIDECEDTLALAREYCQTKHILYNVDKDQLLIYKNGTWCNVNEAEIKVDIINTIMGGGKLSVNKLNNVIERVKTIMTCNNDQFNQDSLINLQNGTYDIRSFNFRQHNHEDMLTIVLPYPFVQNAECPLWLRSLDEIFEGNLEYINILQEFFGYCLTKSTKHESIMFFVGMGSNGKGVIMDTLKTVVGENNCSALSLNQLADPVMLSGIVGKLVNISTEVSRTSKAFEDIVKAIATGDSITVNPKYIKPFEIKPFCKLVFSCNSFPRIEDRTKAFYRRLLLLEFKKEFKGPANNKELRRDLKTEIPGILNWSIEGLRRLENQKGFTDSEHIKNSVEHLTIENNQVKHFCMENIMIKEGFSIPKGELYDRYKSWAEKNGYGRLSNISFGKEIYNLYHHTTEKHARDSRGARHLIWPNLTIKTFEVEVQEEWQE